MKKTSCINCRTKLDQDGRCCFCGGIKDIDGLLDRKGVQRKNGSPVGALLMHRDHLHRNRKMQGDRAATKRIRQDLQALGKALNSLHPSTKEMLDAIYGATYPVVSFQDSDGAAEMHLRKIKCSNKADRDRLRQLIGQSEKTHLYRWSGSVPMDEIIRRLSTACDGAENASKEVTKPGKPIDLPLLVFIMAMADIYETHTDGTPSHNSGTFTEFISLCMDTCGEPDQDRLDRRKLIKKALLIRRCA